jgi:hypothetical protein
MKVRPAPSTLNSPDFVILSEAKDLLFAARKQVLRCAQDDKS